MYLFISDCLLEEPFFFVSSDICRQAASFQFFVTYSVIFLKNIKRYMILLFYIQNLLRIFLDWSSEYFIKDILESRNIVKVK